MASMLSSSDLHVLSVLIVLFLFSSLSAPTIADVLPSVPVTPGAACNSTPYPGFCKSILPNTPSANLFDYGRLSIKRSLSMTKKFSLLVDQYLRRRASYSVATVRALEDCRLLTDLNMDYLSTTFGTLNSSTSTLVAVEADEVQTLLSAIVTNQQTCMDGLQATSSAAGVENGLSTPLFNGTRLYRVSLALVTRAWIPKQRKKKKKKQQQQRGTTPRATERVLFSGLEAVRRGRLNLRMSDKNRRVYESASGRRLLQSTDSAFIREVVIVNQNGTDDFITISDAVAAAENNTDVSDGYYCILVKAGVYEEYVSIAKNKKYLMIIGDGVDQTIITGNRSVVDGWTTFNSATFAVVGQGFVGMNFTIQNTAGAIKHQAVALRSGADFSTFFGCRFEGYQDTLYTHSLRQFYRECDIYGTVDFIFGNAAVVFQNCNIYARLPMQNQFNAVTAQGRTDPNQNTGTSIQNCTITAAPDLASNNGTAIKTYLGRPWKEYSRTVVMQSYIDTVIDPAGWREWSGDFALSTLYYAEYNNAGPGSDTSRRVGWGGYNSSISASDASNFTVSNFLAGDAWIPPTGVPYAAGFV